MVGWRLPYAVLTPHEHTLFSSVPILVQMHPVTATYVCYVSHLVCQTRPPSKAELRSFQNLVLHASRSSEAGTRSHMDVPLIGPHFHCVPIPYLSRPWLLEELHTICPSSVCTSEAPSVSRDYAQCMSQRPCLCSCTYEHSHFELYSRLGMSSGVRMRQPVNLSGIRTQARPQQIRTYRPTFCVLSPHSAQALCAINFCRR